MRTKAHRSINYDLCGQSIGQLYVEGRVLNTPDIGARDCIWLCYCNICQSSCIKKGYDLRSRKTKSCGCRSSGRSKFNSSRNDHGYIMLHRPWHPNAKKDGRVLEHVLVMSHMLKRPLRDGETVHHKNGIRDDNRPENLELWTSQHGRGVRASDLTKFCIEHLKIYAPWKLRES